MRRRFFVLALLVCSVPVAVFAGGGKYVFTSFDFPGATDTNGYGINNASAIVGDFTYTSGGAIHGFIWSAGNFTQVDVPGALNSTVLSGINDAGTAVGDYNDSPMGYYHGFVFSWGCLHVGRLPRRHRHRRPRD
jgi:hypothetical protein